MISIAIDGPAGAGKSTIAKAVAKKLSFIYVDTGALYRAIGLYALKNNLNSEKEVIFSLKEIKVDLKFENNSQKVFLCDEDVSEKIRTPEVSMMASKVSAISAVREFLFDLQRDLARKNNVIMDGRDIGTVVLPEADVKVFLTADAAVRAKRRFLELTERKEKVDYNTILAEINERDHNDKNRAVAPLKQADDAILLDTSEMSFDESIQALVNIIRKGTDIK